MAAESSCTVVHILIVTQLAAIQCDVPHTIICTCTFMYATSLKNVHMRILNKHGGIRNTKSATRDEAREQCSYEDSDEVCIQFTED